MCVPGLDPFTLAMAATSAAGSLYNANTQNNAIKRQNVENRKAMEIAKANRDLEVERQQGWEADQAARVSEALLGVNPAGTATEVAAKVDDPTNEIVQSAEDYNVPVLTGQVADGKVSKAIGEIVMDRVAKTKDMLRAQATLSGQNVAFGGAQDQLTRMAGDLANTGSKRSGSLGVSRMETSIPAASVYANDSPIGDILMIAGMLGSGYGGKMAAAGKPVFGTPIGQPLVNPGIARANGWNWA